jgi:hypothetical protein
MSWPQICGLVHPRRIDTEQAPAKLLSTTVLLNEAITLDKGV